MPCGVNTVHWVWSLATLVFFNGIGSEVQGSIKWLGVSEAEEVSKYRSNFMKTGCDGREAAGTPLIPGIGSQSPPQDQ